MFTDGGETWQAIFDKNLGASGVKATQPEVDPRLIRSGGSGGRLPPAGHLRRREPEGGAVESSPTTSISGARRRGTLVLFFGGGLSRSCSASRRRHARLADSHRPAVGAVYVNWIRNTPLTLVMFFFAFCLPILLRERIDAILLATLALGSTRRPTSPRRCAPASTRFPSARPRPLAHSDSRSDR
jgi:hypothetical protein